VEFVLNIERQKVSQKPIGYINTDFGKKEIKKQSEKVVSIMIINREFIDALDGIELYSHLIIVYFMHIGNRYQGTENSS
jgi:tRNA (Thr-GGU) A37 N-methylase